MSVHQRTACPECGAPTFGEPECRYCARPPGPLRFDGLLATLDEVARPRFSLRLWLAERWRRFARWVRRQR